MNERIRELREQSIKWAYENQQSMDGAMDKFAELLIEKCVSRIKRVGILEDIENETDMVADAIKEHFGVK